MDNHSDGTNDVGEVEDEVEVDVEEDIEKTKTPKVDNAMLYLLYDITYFEKKKVSGTGTIVSTPSVPVII